MTMFCCRRAADIAIVLFNFHFYSHFNFHFNSHFLYYIYAREGGYYSATARTGQPIARLLLLRFQLLEPKPKLRPLAPSLGVADQQ